jgi:hypothetical protein
MASATATGNPVIDAINRLVTNGRVRLAMMMGSGLETTWNAKAVGDHGTSFGAYQMHIGGALTSAGGTPAQAEDPAWATRAMLGAYTAGVAKVPESMWDNDPKNAAALAAFYAEEPAHMYAGSRVDSVWRAMSGSSFPTGPPPATSPTVPAAGDQVQALNPLSPATPGFWKDLVNKDLRNLLLTGLFVLGGLGLVAAGAWRSVGPRVQSVAAKGVMP